MVSSWLFVIFIGWIVKSEAFSFHSTGLHLPPHTSSSSLYFEGRGDYYGESGSSYMVKEFSMYEQLEEIVQLASQSLPKRPDGIVTVVKYTSSTRDNCRVTEGQYEQLAREYPSTLFLRTFEDFTDAPLLFSKADISSYPTYDLFYGGNRVARLEGSSTIDLKEWIDRYGLMNSNLDLFSEQAQQTFDGTFSTTKTPTTTARFIPGYDWDKRKGFFDETADQMENDFEDSFGNWLPNTEDN